MNHLIPSVREADLTIGPKIDATDNVLKTAPRGYRAEPHMPYPPLPSMDERIPTLQIIGGPGNKQVGKTIHGTRTYCFRWRGNKQFGRHC